MRCRKLGQTKLDISVFSIKTKRLAFDPDAADAAERTEAAVGLLRRAFDLGVNHIITARSYGNSDALVGQALDGLDRSKFVVSAKLPICDSADDMKAWLDETLGHLRTDFIDILTLHAVNTAQCLNKVTSPTGCMKAVEQAQEQGIIKHLGFSTNGPLEFILKAMDTELFDAIHVHFSYFNQRNLPVLDKAKEMNLGVFVSSPSERGGSLYTPSPALVDMCEPFHPVVVNDRFLFQYPTAVSLTVTPSRIEELEVHAPAFDNDGALTDAETVALARMDVRRLQLPDSWCTFCHECLPCPERIHIPEILRLRNMGLAYDLVEHCRSQYKWLDDSVGSVRFQGRPGDKCTECGDCLPRCPEKLEIPKLLAEAHALFRSANKRKTAKPKTRTR